MTQSFTLVSDHQARYIVYRCCPLLLLQLYDYIYILYCITYPVQATKDTKAEVAEGEAVEGEVAEEAGADVPALELPEDGDAGDAPKEDNGQTATETEEGADEQASGGDTPKDANEMEELALADDPEAGSGDEHERQQRELGL